MIGLWCVLGLTGVASEKPQEKLDLPSNVARHQQEELENVAMNAIKEFLEDSTQISQENKGKSVQDLEKPEYNPYEDPGNWVDVPRGSFTIDGQVFTQYVHTYVPPAYTASRWLSSYEDGSGPMDEGAKQ